MDGEENYRRVVLSNTGEGETDVGKPVSICVDPVNGLVWLKGYQVLIFAGSFEVRLVIELRILGVLREQFWLFCDKQAINQAICS